MVREYHKWHSPNLGREMELLVFGHGGARVVVFPTRDGRFFDFENWKMVAAVADKLEAGYFQLYCVDSNDRDSLYADWMDPRDRIKRHLDYERYILEEVIPFSARRNALPFIAAVGCSLGAYHAMNITLKHPGIFGKVVALSGRYDLTQAMGPFRDLFDGYYDESIYFNTPTHFVSLMENQALLDSLRRLQIFFAIGREDAFLENNLVLSRIFTAKNIPHHLHICEGEAHRPRFWRPLLSEYL